MNLLLILPFLGTLLSKLLRAVESERIPSHGLDPNAGRIQWTSRLRLASHWARSTRNWRLCFRVAVPTSVGLGGHTARGALRRPSGEKLVGWGKAVWLAAAGSIERGSAMVRRGVAPGGNAVSRCARAVPREKQRLRARAHWLRCVAWHFATTTQRCGAMTRCRRAADPLAGLRRQPCLVPVHLCTEARAIVHDQRSAAARFGPGSRHLIDWA